MPNVLNSGKSFWVGTFIYLAAMWATFNIAYLGYPFLIMSAIFLLVTCVDFSKRRGELNKVVFLGNVSTALFFTPALLIITVKDIDQYGYLFDVLEIVCLAGLVGGIVCAAFIKFPS